MQKILYLFFVLFVVSINCFISLLAEFNANLFSDFNSFSLKTKLFFFNSFE